MLQGRTKDSVDGPPPGASQRGRGGGNGWELLVVAPDEITAHLMQGMLEDSGIEVMLDASNPSPGAFLMPFGDPRAPVKLYVRADDVARASMLLKDEMLTTESPEVEPARASSRTVLGIVIVLVVGILMLIEIFDFAPCVIGAFCF